MITQIIGSQNLMLISLPRICKASHQVSMVNDSCLNNTSSWFHSSDRIEEGLERLLGQVFHMGFSPFLDRDEDIA
jgi:hypothetical protein